MGINVDIKAFKYTLNSLKVSDYVSIAMSCDGVIEIYDFIVNVGLQKVR